MARRLDKKMNKVIQAIRAQGLDPHTILRTLPSPASVQPLNTVKPTTRPSSNRLTQIDDSFINPEEKDNMEDEEDEEDEEEGGPGNGTRDAQNMDAEDCSIICHVRGKRQDNKKTTRQEDEEDNEDTESEDTESKDTENEDKDGAVLKPTKQKTYADFTLSDIVTRSGNGEVIEPILKPKGTGGRDFNIREHIGLGADNQDNRDWYKEILDCVRRECNSHLNTRLSIRGQDLRDIMTIRLNVIEEMPELRHFDAGWPIYAIIQQYLKNTSERSRVQRKQRAKRIKTIAPALHSSSTSSSIGTHAATSSTGKSVALSSSKNTVDSSRNKTTDKSSSRKSTDNLPSTAPNLMTQPPKKGTLSVENSASKLPLKSKNIIRLKPRPNFQQFENEPARPPADDNDHLEMLGLENNSDVSKGGKRSFGPKATVIKKITTRELKRKQMVDSDNEEEEPPVKKKQVATKAVTGKQASKPVKKAHNSTMTTNKASKSSKLKGSKHKD